VKFRNCKNTFFLLCGKGKVLKSAQKPNRCAQIGSIVHILGNTIGKISLLQYNNVSHIQTADGLTCYAGHPLFRHAADYSAYSKRVAE